MIFGKINPAAFVVQQTGPFTTTTVTGSYMTAIARPYVLGSAIVNFEVRFGDVTLNGSGSVESFYPVLTSEVAISGSAISDWGTDDVAMLSTIALAAGTTVESTVSGNLYMF